MEAHDSPERYYLDLYLALRCVASQKTRVFTTVGTRPPIPRIVKLTSHLLSDLHWLILRHPTAVHFSKYSLIPR